MRKRIINTGMRVGYAKAFLRSIAAGPCDDMWRLKGTILPSGDALGGLNPDRFAVVVWDSDPEPMIVNKSNLAKVGSLSYCEDVS